MTRFSIELFMRRLLTPLCLTLLLFTFISTSLSAGEDKKAQDIELTQLSNDGKTQAVAWAYRGDMIAAVRNISRTQKQLLVLKSDGSDEEAVSPIGNPFYAKWSWSGDKLAYEFSNTWDNESQGGAFIYNVATKKSLAISSPYRKGDFEENDGPTWSADEKQVTYVVEPGITNRKQIWLADANSGNCWQILSDRERVSRPRFSPIDPMLLSLQMASSGERSNVVTVDHDSEKITFLTDVGGQPISVRNPTWSPTGEWVAYLNDEDMTLDERGKRRNDLWISRPDGSEARNLTNASTQVTEEQLSLRNVNWSWDGRWILADGSRYDSQGTSYPTLYLIDVINGGHSILHTSHPKETQEIEFLQGIKWSYDSTKILCLTRRSTVRNWTGSGMFGGGGGRGGGGRSGGRGGGRSGGESQFTNNRTGLAICDIATKTFEDLLEYNTELDRTTISNSQRGGMGGAHWSPDNKSILLTISDVISQSERQYETNIYRLDLPERLHPAPAAQRIGPPIGLNADVGASANAAPSDEDQDAPTYPGEVNDIPPPLVDKMTNGVQISTLITPLNITVAEAVASLPQDHTQYLTQNVERNLLLFKGPEDALLDLQHDMALIDTPPPHILVDLMGIELSDEANRNLGLDWTYVEGRFGLFQPTGNAIRDLTPDPGLMGMATYPGAGQSFYQGVGSLPREFFVRLNTLVNDGEATILANPRTVATSAKESSIEIRRMVNFFFNEGFDTSGRPVVKKSDISAITEAKITPTLLPNGRIHLKVLVSVGTFTFSQDAGLPEQTTRKAETEVTVAQGDSIVIGGLRQQEVSRVVSKLPVLGSIPYIKPLFQRTEAVVQHSVLTIFITPQLMSDDDPSPAWPELNGEDQELAPISDIDSWKESNISLTGKSLTKPKQSSSWFRRLLAKIGIAP